MTDQEIQHYLQTNGYPDHLVRAGKAGLLHGWRNFVRSVEQGYALGLEDYRNDLDLRGIIALVGLDREVEAEDERLRSALTDTGIRVWESSVGDPFWDFGYPKNAGDDLIEDLKAEKLI